MNIFVPCEESQAVTIELRKLGHKAFSGDIIECSGGHPEWHIQGDALKLINGNCTFQTMDGQTHTIEGKWDMIIAFPPCTYMSNAGACRMFPKKGQIDPDRFAKAMEAKAFFMAFYNADCERISIENPVPLSVIGLPEKSQMIQPYQFGHPYTKKTYLWLKGLPILRFRNSLKISRQEGGIASIRMLKSLDRKCGLMKSSKIMVIRFLAKKLHQTSSLAEKHLQEMMKDLFNVIFTERKPVQRLEKNMCTWLYHKKH